MEAAFTMVSARRLSRLLILFATGALPAMMRLLRISLAVRLRVAGGIILRAARDQDGGCGGRLKSMRGGAGLRYSRFRKNRRVSCFAVLYLFNPVGITAIITGNIPWRSRLGCKRGSVSFAGLILLLSVLLDLSAFTQ